MALSSYGPMYLSPCVVMVVEAGSIDTYTQQMLVPKPNFRHLASTCPQVSGDHLRHAAPISRLMFGFRAPAQLVAASIEAEGGEGGRGRI